MDWAGDVAGGAFAYLSIPSPNPPELTRKWQQGECQQPSAFPASNAIPTPKIPGWIGMINILTTGVSLIRYHMWCAWRVWRVIICELGGLGGGGISGGVCMCAGLSQERSVIG